MTVWKDSRTWTRTYRLWTSRGHDHTITNLPFTNNELLLYELTVFTFIFHMHVLLFPLMPSIIPLIKYWFWFTDSLNTTTATTTHVEKTLTLCFQWKCTFLKEAFKGRKGIYGQFNFDVKWKKYVFAILSYFFCFNLKTA